MMKAAQYTAHQDITRAYGRLYQLLQMLYLEGLTAETLPLVQTLPDLAEALPSAQVQTPDQLAATHQELFSFQLFPYESIFLGSKGLLGTEFTEQVGSFYQQVGYVPTAQSGAADHLGEELGLLAHLCAAEADAWEDEKPAIAQRMQREQQRFLETHLLRWFVPCATAIQQQGESFYAHIATITVSLLGDHYATVHASIGTEVAATSWRLPPAPTLLTDPKTTLKDIANFLATPVYSGFFCSRHFINRLGRAERLPRGFGSREQMLTNLLRTAAQYEKLPELLHAMQTELATWQQQYQTYSSEQPVLAPFVQPWQSRLADSMTFLSAIDVALMAAQAEI